MSNSHFAPDAIAFLATLGWAAGEFVQRTIDGQLGVTPNDVLHPTISSLIVRRASLRTKSRYDPTIFVFEWLGATYPHKGLVIEPKTIDTKKPHWRKAAMLWYTRAVFVVEQIRIEHENEKAEVAAKRLAYDTALRDAMPADCKVGVEDLQRIARFAFAHETRAITRADVHYHLGWCLPTGLDPKEAVAKLARATAFFINEGFVKR